jgi:hypothetical protein
MAYQINDSRRKSVLISFIKWFNLINNKRKYGGGLIHVYKILPERQKLHCPT